MHSDPTDPAGQSADDVSPEASSAESTEASGGPQDLTLDGLRERITTEIDTLEEHLLSLVAAVRLPDPEVVEVPVLEAPQEAQAEVTEHPEEPDSTDDTASFLRHASASIDAAENQSEVLSRLLELAAGEDDRAAMLLCPTEHDAGDRLSIWNAAGFEGELAGTTIEVPEWAAPALQGEAPVRFGSSEASDLCSALDGSSADAGLLVPFVLRDTPRALLLWVADGDGTAEAKSNAIQLLTFLATQCLEALSLRKNRPAGVLAEPVEVGLETDLADLADSAEPADSAAEDSADTEATAEAMAIEDAEPEVEVPQADELATMLVDAGTIEAARQGAVAEAAAETAETAESAQEEAAAAPEAAEADESLESRAPTVEFPAVEAPAEAAEPMEVQPESSLADIAEVSEEMPAPELTDPSLSEPALSDPALSGPALSDPSNVSAFADDGLLGVEAVSPETAVEEVGEEVTEGFTEGFAEEAGEEADFPAPIEAAEAEPLASDEWPSEETEEAPFVDEPTTETFPTAQISEPPNRLSEARSPLMGPPATEPTAPIDSLETPLESPQGSFVAEPTLGTTAFEMEEIAPTPPVPADDVAGPLDEVPPAEPAFEAAAETSFEPEVEPPAEAPLESPIPTPVDTAFGAPVDTPADLDDVPVASAFDEVVELPETASPATSPLSAGVGFTDQTPAAPPPPAAFDALQTVALPNASAFQSLEARTGPPVETVPPIVEPPAVEPPAVEPPTADLPAAEPPAAEPVESPEPPTATAPPFMPETPAEPAVEAAPEPAPVVEPEPTTPVSAPPDQSFGRHTDAPAQPARSSSEVSAPSDLVGPGLAFRAGEVDSSSQAVASSGPAHDEARRLARLLVSEIKLYNEEQIEQGIREGNVYRLLREDIDRSKRMYEERIDADLLQATDYFRDELVRSLARGNAAVLGL